MSMNTYQPIYDAACQRIGHPDISGTIERVCRDSFDISWLKRLFGLVQIVVLAVLMYLASARARPTLVVRCGSFVLGVFQCGHSKGDF